MEIDKQQIVDALYRVKDPSTGKDIIAARMVENLQTEGNNVNFNLVLPSLNSPHKSNLIFDCVATVKEVYPNADVNVHVVAKALGAEERSSSVPQIKNIIAVASGKGGVGKSTVSVNLALGLKRLGAKVGLIDADLYGPSIPTMFGLQGQRPRIQEINGQPKIIPLMAYDIPVMSIGFIIEPEQAVVLRGPRLAAIIKQFFNDVVWPDLDYLVVDLPPGTGDIQLTLVQTVPVTGAIVVTTPQEVAVVDAVKAMNMFLMPSVNVPILGVVENMAWFTPEDMPDRKYFLFGQGGGKRLAVMAESVLLGQVPIVQGIREGGDSGKPVVVNPQSMVGEAFIKIAENTVRQVEIRNERLEPTKIVNVTS
ncbi:MAG: Mrp/NBP35 family ATP-binding protein [Saprospiraceae bacterium]|nr:Mrp/NBP35 family ATP-binding protein [Saprospiraceae bacterium]